MPVWIANILSSHSVGFQDAAFVIWFAYVGGCIGSFLNVVYHRLPRGEDIVFQSSRCPMCEAPIRTRHNLPIVGWLMLRGRCYDCQAPIPIRYWLYEVVFAVVFGVCGWWFLVPVLPWK